MLLLRKQLRSLGYQVTLWPDCDKISNTIIYLGQIKKQDDSQSLKDLTQDFINLKTIGQAIINKSVRLTVITNRQLNPIAGGLSGLVKTAAHEWPQCKIQLIDTELEQITPEQLIQCPRVTEILWREGKAFTPGIAKDCMTQANCRSSLSNESVVLVSGGGRGVTAACIKALSDSIHPHFILIGRTRLVNEGNDTRHLKDDRGLKSYFIEEAKKEGAAIHLPTINRKSSTIMARREIKENIAFLEKNQCKVDYLSVDLTDQEDLSNAINSLALTRPITAIIHGAGVIADKIILDKSAEDFNKVVLTKIRGLLNLISCVEMKSIKVLIAFGSVAGVYGNIGQADYATGNEALNHLADSYHAHLADDALIKVLNWAPIDSGMVTESLKKKFIEKGVPVLPIKETVDLFCRECLQPPDREIHLILGSNTPLSQSAMEISSDHYPLLNDHQINSKIVIPLAVIATEIFRYYQLNIPVTVNNLRVLSSIPIQQGDTVSLQPSRQQGSYLIYYDNKPAYKFQVSSTADSAKRVSLNNEKTWLVNADTLYQTILFHGKSLQLIKSLNTLASNGCTATIAHSNILQWSLMDAALQLAIVWIESRIHQLSVPMSIERASYYQFGQENMDYSAILIEREIENNSGLVDVQILDQSGDIVLQLQGISMICYGGNHAH